MKKVYKEAECATGALDGKVIAILGYGSQGHAHAKNLHDSGYDVVVGLYEGSKSRAKAEAAGLKVLNTAEAVKAADVIMVLLPDEKQASVYKQDIEPNLTEGKALAFAHGFNIHYQCIIPPENVDVFMIAPKGPGHTVRSEFELGHGVPSLYAVYQDYTGHAMDIALAYGAGIGSARAGLLGTTFREETETDLFGEQAVLCGGVAELMKTGFEVLTEAGYDPENAYYECMHEMKLIVDLVYQGGLSLMRYSISNTAEYGDYCSGRRVITPATKEAMRGILKDIQDGTFATQWLQECQSGQITLKARRRLESQHPVEVVGKELRGLMSWNHAIEVE
ncbi:MAG: ketol-acid reductoisomerase [Oscillospiraceae bacterium]|nr:ketol-acid reductoisomerase [Oscillospiraceae bacterium]MDD4367511.1 ketol-acid reductoisomerase [Oscillospiraceae bacterium]